MLLWPRRDQDVANCVRRQRGRPARQGAHSEASSTRRSAGTGTTKWSEPELTRSHERGSHDAGRKSWKSAQEPE
ncbi:hypothetical protein NDU88_001505 [Pleurodeles waltl]|uniref:Uncharacterized protein n=1 Tax=Pleurodeles waltl TaxID=8319 RepID=A0AAV7NBB3_PLEWA|nr:hypothetical protein NDU88_001505 [Pleurodeles waltl]